MQPIRTVQLKTQLLRTKSPITIKGRYTSTCMVFQFFAFFTQVK